MLAATMSDKSTSAGETPTATPALLVLLAAGAGLSAASLYYNQPILGAIAQSVGASSTEVGLLPTLTQLGYAAGIFLFAPLGDRFDLRKVIMVKGTLLALTLFATSVAPSIAVLSVLSFAIGLTATTAQDFVPAAAAMARPEARGRTVGMAMTGLLLGILLSRVMSGAVSERFGWRAVYVGSSALVAMLVAIAALRVPGLPPTSSMNYLALLRSTLELLQKHAPLRRAAVAQPLIAAAFSGFWATLALVLARPPFELGSTVAGAFGLAGAAGALAAPIAGSIADKRGPRAVIRVGASLVFASFLAMAIAPGSLAVLIVATVVFDLGVHAALISHQTIVYGLDPTARSRLNAVLVSAMFIGMAAGSSLASRLCARYGLAGVGVQGAVAAALALAVYARREPPVVVASASSAA